MQLYKAPFYEVIPREKREGGGYSALIRGSCLGMSCEIVLTLLFPTQIVTSGGIR